MPVAEDLPLAYREYYTHGDEPQGALRSVARDGYRASVNLLVSQFSKPGETEEAARMFIERKPPGRLLDVGCGHGRFMTAMAKQGWSVFGIDFDGAAVEAARPTHGNRVRVGTIDDVVASGERYDVVCASHVLEHVENPIHFLKQCRAILNPNGIVAIKTPNVRSYGHQRFGRDWRGLEPPRHLHIFTSEALRECAQSAKLQVLKLVTTAVSAEQILLASYYLRRDGEFRTGSRKLIESVIARIIGPVLSIQARRAWSRDGGSGEEICAILQTPELLTEI